MRLSTEFTQAILVKKRKNCDLNPDSLPMPHGVNLVYGQNQSDQTRRNQGNAKPIGAYLISSSEEELSILKPNFSFC
jgi:hypothetical protein